MTVARWIVGWGMAMGMVGCGHIPPASTEGVPPPWPPGPAAATASSRQQPAAPADEHKAPVPKLKTLDERSVPPSPTPPLPGGPSSPSPPSSHH
jgi:hypothetical protein